MVSFGVADGAAVADGDSSGVGVGDAFFRFDLLLGVEVGEGVGDAFPRFGEAVGAGVGVVLFVECFRCLRDELGVGSGSRAFLIFEPSDSSAAEAGATALNSIAEIKR